MSSTSKNIALFSKHFKIINCNIVLECNIVTNVHEIYMIFNVLFIAYIECGKNDVQIIIYLLDFVKNDNFFHLVNITSLVENQ